MEARGQGKAGTCAIESQGSSLAKTVIGRDSYIERGGGGGGNKNLPPAPQVPDWGWGQGKAGKCAIEIKMVQGEILYQRDLLV